MANGVDGQIVLGLDISQTTAKIQTGLDKILNSTKTKEIVLRTAIEKAETEKSIDALVKKINKRTIDLGIEVDTKDVQKILVEQQKIASTQARLNAQMNEYRETASKIGLTLSKNSWNPFGRAVKDGDFDKANEILKSTKKQIEEYNTAVQKMNSDTSLSGSVSSIIKKFAQLKNVSSDTQNRINLLQANMKQFETADSTKNKLAAYNRLQTSIEKLTLEYDQLRSAEKGYVSDSNIQEKYKNAQSLYSSLSKVYSSVDSNAGSALKSSLEGLNSALSTFDKVSKGLSGGKLASEWDKVDAAIQDVTRSLKEYKAEQTVTGKIDTSLTTTIKKINDAIDTVNSSGKSGTNIDNLKKSLQDLSTRSVDLQTQLSNLDPSNGDDVIRLQSEIKKLNDELLVLQKNYKVEINDTSIKKKIEDARTLQSTYSKIYSTASGNAGSALKSSLEGLNSALNAYDENSANLSGDKLSAEWNKIDVAIQKVITSLKEYRAENTVIGTLDSSVSTVIDDIDTAFNRIDNVDASGTDKLKEQLAGLKDKAIELQKELSNLDPSNGDDVNNLSSKIKELRKNFQNLSGDIKIFGDANQYAQFIKNVETLRQKVAEYAETYSAIKHNPELMKQYETIKKMMDGISDPTSYKAAQAAFAQFDTQVIQAGAHTKSLSDSLKTAFTNFLQFFSASRIMYMTVELLKDMVSNVKELDAAMIELRKVTDETDTTYTKFLTNAKTRAVELGTTVTDLVNATSDFSRLGYSLEEATELGEIATIYANVGDDVDSIEQATTSLISTIKGFGLEASDAMSIVDKFNEVGNNFAISSGGIGDALQRSAAALKAAGNDIDQSIALIVAANNVIQDADTVGTMWKTVSMRIRGAKTELEAAGLETEYMAESTATLRDTIMGITNIDGMGGIDILTDSGAFKDTYTIILEIAQIWEKLGETDPVGQSALLELLAGKRQGNALAAVLTNIEDLVAVLETSQNASEGIGSAMEEYSKYLEGIEGKTNQFKAAFEALSSTIVNSDFLKGLIDKGTSLITIIDNIINAFGGLGTTISVIVALIASINLTNTISSVKTFGTLIKNLLITLGKKGWDSSFVKGVQACYYGLKSLVTGSKQAEQAFTLLGGSASVATAAITALVAVIGIAILAYQKHKQKIEENRQAAEDAANAYHETCSSVDEYKEKINALRKEIDEGNLSEQEAYDKRTELISIQETLIDMFGKEAEGINLVTGAIEDQKIAIDNLQKSKWETWNAENVDAIDKMKETYSSDVDSYWRMSFTDNSKQYSQLQNSLKLMTEESADYFEKYWTEKISWLDTILGLRYTTTMQFEASDYQEGIDVLTKYINEVQNLPEYKSDPNQFQSILSSASAELNRLKSSLSDYEEIYDTYYSGLLKYDEQYKTLWSRILDAQESYDTALVKGDSEAILNAVSAMQKLKDEFLAAGWDDELVNQYVNDFFDKFSLAAQNYEIQLNLKAELSNDRSQITDTVQRAISVLKDESGKIDTYAVANIGFTIDDTDISMMNEQQKAYLGLKAVADEYQISVVELIAILEQLGYIEQKQIESNQQEVSETQETINAYRNKINILKKALNEYNKNGSVTTETYNKVIALGEDYANMFDFSTGKIVLQTDALETHVDSLVNETGALLAANNATDDEISALASMAAAFRQTAAETEVTTSTLKELTDLLTDAQEGTEYSTLAMLDLIEQYPELVGAIQESENGYKLEKGAVLELIAAKAELLKINESLAKQAARDVLNENTNNNGKSAATVDAIFEEYYAETGKQIESFDEYVTAWEKHFNKESTGDWITGLEDYVNASINEIVRNAAIDNLMDDLLNPENYKFGSTSSSSSSTKTETEFEKAYKKHQHLLNMDQESVAEYLTWLNSAYKAAYDAGQIELDDYYKYQEEVYQKTQDLFKDSLNDDEHKISLLERQDGSTAEIISMYQKMQEAVHEQAEKYRAMNIDDDSELIQELQNLWWSYYDAITDKMIESYDEIVNNSQNQITLTENLLDNAVADGNYTKVRQYSDEIIAQYRKMQETIHDEAEYYRSLGYSNTSDEVSKLSDLWWDYQANIEEAASAGFQALVDNAHSALDDIQDVYSTLTDAAQEQADSGFLTVDTYQKILSLGANYLAYLTNENGQLVINEENIKKCVAARTQQVAVETALNYIQQLRTALTENDTAALQNLLYATDAATDSTWGLVYAQLAALELTDDQYNTALQRIDAIRSLADNAVTSIGQETGQLAEQANQAAEAMKEQLQETSDALDDILKYTIEMIKQEVNNQIDALKQQVEEYQNIVDLKKESLELTKEQDEYDENVADKVKDISKLEAKIQQLSLDDSREAQAEKAKLQEELAEMQNDLADYQSDYAYDATIDSLDKQAEAYEAEKDKEIAILEDSISSYEKVYQMAIDRINNHWDTLYMDLINWNTQYGSDTNETITSAWNNASAAVQQYGNYLAAVQATQAALNAATSASSSSYGSVSSGSLSLGTANDYSADAAKGRQVSNLVSKMKANSASWWDASDEERTTLEEENVQLAAQVQALLGKKLVRGADGVWYIGSVGSSDLLYEKYHEGGIVGGKPTLKDKETIAILEEGELVLDEDQKEKLHKTFSAFDEAGVDRDKFNTVMFGQSPNQAVKTMDEIRNQSMNEAMEQVTNNNVKSDVHVDAPITINGDVDGDTWKKIYPALKDHQKQVADITCKEIMSVFSRRGIRK